MRNLTPDQLHDLLIDATTIEEDGHGLKVARLQNGDFLKLYRRKRLLSSALWSSPSARFASNAEHLRKLGIASPAIRELLVIPALQLNAVMYCPLPGETLRNRWRRLDLAQRTPEAVQLGVFIGKLHQLGIYFRSLHLGNILSLPDMSFGLIDLSDMTITGKPLSSWKRQRNLQHMLRYKEDSAWLTNEHRSELLHGYCQECGSKSTAHFAKYLPHLRPGGERP